MNLNLRTLLLSGLIVSFGTMAFAQKNVMTKPRPVTQLGEFKPHIGLLFGAAQPEYSGITANEVAVDIGFQPYIPFGLGAELSHVRIDSGQGPENRDTILFKGSYHLGGSTVVLKDSYFGLGLGAVFKPYGTSLVMAPLVGFDIPVSQTAEGKMTLGANLKYAIVGDDELDTTTLSGVVKYWY